ncbi:hypothetical protein M7I_0490 [Glarea lozoyensis 74030]|uniref:Uncharacterized protein n=1 Tax=Glarea lozoyensis (strain ATCC 74030 / MF5533) TaxID=1104152 RepID=H0EDN5_GLAL7|nr:hypothetical protein M7I_0490 [Glarea lozoyensis 74030]
MDHQDLIQDIFSTGTYGITGANSSVSAGPNVIHILRMGLTPRIIEYLKSVPYLA